MEKFGFSDGVMDTAVAQPNAAPAPRGRSRDPRGRSAGRSRSPRPRSVGRNSKSPVRSMTPAQRRRAEE